jgi:putative hemolysin
LASELSVDSAPPERIVNLLLASLPAIFAAAFAAASWAMARVSGTRRAALRDTLQGGARRALERYAEHASAIESRWLLIRALGVATSALLIGKELPSSLGAWLAPVAALIALVVYGIPSEVARALAGRNPERTAPLLLQVLYPLEMLVVPIAAPFVWLGTLLGKGVVSERETARPPGVTETEVELIVNEGEMNGSLDHDQSEMIRNVLDFGDVTAGQVTVPRTQVVAFEIATPIEEVLRKVTESGHSRYPVYRDNIDNVVGIVHVKDLLRHAARGDLNGHELASLARQPVVFVPESQSATTVLKDMRAGRHHMAVVIDEFGGFSGVVTLEDLLEQIVGDIRDEHDVEEPPIVDLGDGKLMVNAGVAIADLSRYLGAELPENGDYNTLGGFIVAQLGRVPEPGTKLSALGLEFEVRDADGRRVSKVEITRRALPPESLVPPRSSSRITAA